MIVPRTVKLFVKLNDPPELVHRSTILCKGAGTVTVKKGTGYAGVTDLILTVTGDMQYFTLDSSRYTDIETGLITINAATTQIAVLAPRV